MPQLEQIEAIEKRLWKAADTLRANSNYASNEYFLPVMGLVFLRHAYSRFLAVKRVDRIPAFPPAAEELDLWPRRTSPRKGRSSCSLKPSSTIWSPSRTARTGPKPSSRRWSQLRRITRACAESCPKKILEGLEI